MKDARLFVVTISNSMPGLKSHEHRTWKRYRWEGLKKIRKYSDRGKKRGLESGAKQVSRNLK